MSRRLVKRVPALALAVAALLAPAGAGGRSAPAPPRRPAFEVGADVSSLPVLESHGVTFRDGPRAGSALALLRARGFTAVRLRLWHSPEGGVNGIDSVLRVARRAHDAGLGLMLDLHYSDTWADPGHQSPPAAWADPDLQPLLRSVHTYTRAVMEAFAAQGTPPDYVQVGNEIDGGILWEQGRVASGDPESWQRLHALLAAAARGVREGAPHARIVVHLAAGGDAEGCRAFLENVGFDHLDADIIGVSYYPWWQGSLEDLADNLWSLARRFDKDVMVVETASPWTYRWFDATRNIVGEDARLAGGCPATPTGQMTFARELRRVLSETPNGHGVGVWWWEPAWIAVPGANSPWENCALFDSAGVMLPAAGALAR